MRRISLIVLFCVFATAALAEVSEKVQKKLDTSEAAYVAAIQKADNSRFYAVQKAAAEYIKVLKQAMADATKAGDLDGANEIKRRIASAEEVGSKRAKPKDAVKLGGHEYAFIGDKVPWHVAKRICEEMGGHLVTMETPAEVAGILALCKAANTMTWIGATDEVSEGEWRWITGGPVDFVFPHQNQSGIEHAMIYFPDTGGWEDTSSGYRLPFVCEWEK